MMNYKITYSFSYTFYGDWFSKYHLGHAKWKGIFKSLQNVCTYSRLLEIILKNCLYIIVTWNFK